MSHREAATRAPARAPIEALSQSGAPTTVKHEVTKSDAASARSSRGTHAVR
jgi:hypothetical protein